MSADVSAERRSPLYEKGKRSADVIHGVYPSYTTAKTTMTTVPIACAMFCPAYRYRHFNRERENFGREIRKHRQDLYHALDYGRRSLNAHRHRCASNRMFKFGMHIVR